MKRIFKPHFVLFALTLPILFSNSCDFKKNLLGDNASIPSNHNPPLSTAIPTLPTLTINDTTKIASKNGLTITGKCPPSQEVTVSGSTLNPNPQTFTCPSSGTYKENIKFETGHKGTVKITVSSKNVASSSISVAIDTISPVEQAYAKAPNVGANDQYGWAIAISGDTAVVGAPFESSNQTTITNGTTASSDNSAAQSGAVYVLKRVENVWTQEAYLKAPNNDAGDYFGWNVAISGDTIVVGAPSESSNQNTITNGTTASSDNSSLYAGAAYVFKRTGVNWTQEAYLKAPNPDSYDQFGWNVAISGDTIVIGAYQESSNQNTITNGNTASADNSAAVSGAAYVFKRTGVNWAQEAFLKASNADAGDGFGASVGISGDTIVVGSIFEGSNQNTITNGNTASADNSLVQPGAAYVFKRTGVNWAQEAYLKAPNVDAGDQFGYSAAISGDTIVVGSYSESSSQNTITNGNTASADNSATDAGAAYVFKRTGANWAQEAYLKTSNMDLGDHFGSAVSIDGDTIAVGAFGESSNQNTITNGNTASSDNSAVESGAVYIFKRTGTSWAQHAYVKSPNANQFDRFGFACGISGDTVIVGAYEESSNQNTITNGNTASSNNSSFQSGSAYILLY